MDHLATLDTGPNGRSPEEEDHLVRSTKKIKSTSAPIEDQDMNDSIQAPTEEQPQRSFKQALTATKANEKAFDNDLERLSDDDFLTDEEDNEAMEEEDLNRFADLGFHVPIIKLPSRLIKHIRRPWKDCLIVRLLGKTLGYKLLVSKLRKMWGLQGDFEATDLGLGFFLIKFEMMVDCSRVYTEGPWIIMDHYLTVRRWEHDFKPSEAGEVATALWVRFPQLPIEYYNEKVLFHIAKAIGKPLKVDLNTAISARGRYARVCVEVDLTKPLISRFAIGKYTYIVEYEHLHYFCFQCGKVGHRKEYCSSNKPVPELTPTTTVAIANGHGAGLDQAQTASSSGKHSIPDRGQRDEFGPWMLVNRKKNNRPNPIARPAGPNNHIHKRSANRFGPLAENGNMVGPPERAKHQGHTGPSMVNTHRTASTSESGNPPIAQEIFLKGQKGERQLNKDQDPAVEGQTLPEIPASSYNPSLGQATNNDLELMNAE
ncbi:uncharacterized protein LOC114304299, partial [Camellia sinensis]|uniref:uncharacterized protein LOC114304299 n=1 Tax=Camellia sinensis TaxID=4442 RepID=UPI0010361002